MRNISDDFVAGLLGFTTAAFAVVLGIVTYGWALSVIWGWFMVPLFGLRQLSIAGAVGVTITARLLVGHVKKTGTKAKEADESDKWMDALITWVGFALEYIVLPVLLVGFAWLVHLYV